MRIWPIIRSLFFRCNEGTGSGTEDKKILDSSESRLAVTRRFCQFFSCRQGSQTNNEGQYHLPIRSSWQKIETDCERGDAGRIKNLFCSFSNRKYVVFFRPRRRERKWALCVCIRDLGCCSDEFKRNLNENNDGNVGPITRRVGSHDDALRRIVGATLPSGSVRYRPANQRRTAADTGSHRAAFGVASVTREFLLFPSAIC